ncbi:MAG: rhodanese-like domain-containing protein [Bacteroidales bacterium]|jgi:rhodanese-related sulfurtransferase|nr:rhodanese-like domain-containing protein [Bacteroidales bacterium]
MKKLLFVLFFANVCAFAFAFTVPEWSMSPGISGKKSFIKVSNNSSRVNSVPDTAQMLMTIEQLIQDSREGVDFINNDELIKRIHANSKVVLIDVRSKEEYDAGHLKGATWLERGVVEFTLARTLRDPNAEIIVYCLKGNRSALVVKALKRMGYQNVKSHVGLEEWFKANLPVYNFLGEVKMVELRKLNAATNPVEYYLDKK